MNEVERLFDTYNANILQALGVEAGLFPPGGKKPSKADVVARLKADLFTEARIKAALAKLTPAERAVLNRLQLRGGQAPKRSLLRELVRAGVATLAPDATSQDVSVDSSVPYASDGYVGLPTRPRSTVFYDLIARLTLHGLVFSRVEQTYYASYNYKLQFHPAEEIFIPDVVKRHLPPPDPVVMDQATVQPARVQAQPPLAFVRDLYLYWDFVRRNDVPLLQNGLVGKRSLKAVNQTLITPDKAFDTASNEGGMPRVFVRRKLLIALGLLQAPGSRLLPTVDPPALPDFWSLGLDEQIARCVRAWVRLGVEQGRDLGITGFVADVLPARQALLDLLLKLTGGVWFDAEDVQERLRDKDTNFLFPRRKQIEGQQGRASYYYSSYYYSETPDKILAKLDQAEIKFLREALGGLLYETGLLELGFNEGGAQAWTVARLTEFGRAALAAVQRTDEGGRAGAAAGDTGRIVVQPNFQILAIGPVPIATLAHLDVFADRVKADAGVFEYHLSRESVYRGQQAGLSGEDVVAFLKTACGDLPQNITRSLAEWAAHHERIVFRPNATLLQAANAAVVVELRADPDVGPHLDHDLTPDIALVKPGETNAVLRLLLARGLLPAVSDDSPASADHSVRFTDDGVAQPVHSVPSLHLSGQLDRVAEREEGRWRITPAVVAREAGDRTAVTRYLDELTRLHSGPLPAPLVASIKRWGGYYGAARAATLTLVEFGDRQTLEELLGDATLGQWLAPFPAGERALAAVPSDRLADVARRLAELGVPLTIEN